ncbi:unnamed protein product [Miscanthus lutarioriparius]|uniref:Plant heme peroxidase family profile domain-containing protein n=1 Tax=Miscanthus lutarioriparius TaxID=422564 RepID=A0A811QYG6_9POAL|nr:unnamed protein product [Miscanthus lutarioriparius]
MARRQWSSGGGGLALAVLAVLSSVLCSGHPVPGGGFPPLQPHFYDHACPQMQAIVGSIVAKAHAEDPRMAASLLRLHFHDCFPMTSDNHGLGSGSDGFTRGVARPSKHEDGGETKE